MISYVRPCVENSRLEASAQYTLQQAPPALDQAQGNLQPRPASAFGRYVRLYRPCFSHRRSRSYLLTRGRSTRSVISSGHSAPAPARSPPLPPPPPPDPAGWQGDGREMAGRWQGGCAVSTMRCTYARRCAPYDARCTPLPGTPRSSIRRWSRDHAAYPCGRYTPSL